MGEESLNCWKCDYDLSGLSTDGQCPECGARIDMDRPGKENVPMAMAALGLSLMAVLVLFAMLAGNLFFNGAYPNMYLSLTVSAALTIPAFVLAERAQPPPPKNSRARPQYPIVSFAMFFALAADTIVFVVLFLSTVAIFDNGLA